MTSDLVGWIEQRIDSDAALDDEVGLLVLAALEGDSELDDYLESGSSSRRGVEVPETAAAVKPARGAFLRSIRVAGFRGIGRPVTLTLAPTPGLTVVAGRNGSGKSSIAEGLELLLTGETYRWRNKRSTQWSGRWRNLHSPNPAEIDAEIVEEGSGKLRLRTSWNSDATDVHARATTVQRTTNGSKGPTTDAAALGWAPLLDTYRPMLSYDELGGLLESGPSELYDALAKILGTEQLADALARVKLRVSRLAEPQRRTAADRKALQAEAATLEDERAAAVAALLKHAAPDTASIRSLTTGVSLPDRGIVASLRALAQLASPDPRKAEIAASRLRAAVSAMADAGEAESARRIARLDLRREALRLHEDHGEQSCPVCSQGTLDDAWVQASRDLVAREAVELERLSDARAELDAARGALRTLMQPRPAATDRAPTAGLAEIVADVRTAWHEFHSLPASDLAAADHVELHAEVLASAVAQARAAANAALVECDDAWEPLAARISAWCEARDEALKKKPSLDLLTAAEKWLKENDTRLKNERIAPLAGAARHAWALLRQESNVDLGSLTLEGSSTRRRVSITATVDGVDAGNALPVMSQGELHALTLALFLPRATMDDSPFRFVVLDDPVQAMDPAKVDGLVTLLTEIAETRQVIVFSHDDRLPAALRRASATARILEVVRGPDSTVTIDSAQDPTTRYLSDALALCSDTKVPDVTLRRTLPGLLRLAIEAAARDRFYAIRLTRGDALQGVEETWNNAHGTSQRVSLAIHDTVTSLDGWLSTESRKKGLGIATSGFHRSLYSGIDPRHAVRHVQRLVDDITSGAK